MSHPQSQPRTVELRSLNILLEIAPLKRATTLASLLITSMAPMALADHSHMEEINITGYKSSKPTPMEISPAEVPVIDTAALLQRVPGANINSNGALTGVAQYRGLYSDRVSIHIDHSPTLTGGPNAMDSPLSFTPPMLLKSLEVHRGIAPVSVAQESIGGHITAKLDRGEFTYQEDLTFSGALSNRFNSSSDGFSNGVKSVLANKNHKVALLASHDEGDDTRIGDDDKLGGTQYRRSRYDISYGWQIDDTVLEIYAGQLDTRDTGTPALPMDISHIDSDMVGANLSKTFGEVVVSGNLSYNHVDHGMDNFSQRPEPMAPMFRQNKATAHNTAWSLQAKWPLSLSLFGTGSSEGFLTVGADGNETVHDSTITNPNNSMFEVKNFSDVERDGYGLFTEWEGNLGAWQVETGVRYTRVSMDSDSVYATGMMGMMGMNADYLADKFNNGNLDKDYHNVDLVFNASRALSSSTTLNVGLGRKNRAPSYQERYLWLPLPSTGGLADGRSYIGNLRLDKETSNEITLGVDWESSRTWATPQVFYRYIDDYIQGVPASDMTANMVSMMMNGRPALMFDSIDAKMYGLDLGYGYALTDSLSLEGNLSYVRGKRDDSNDDLYRIAPLNNRLALLYKKNELKLKIESVLYAKQNKVSEFNEEEETSGYGIVNLSGSYQLTEQLSLSSGVENLFDNRYEDHLAGYNRNSDSDIAVGDRLAGSGRNVYVALSLKW